MQEMITLFLLQCPRLMERVRDAVASEDPARLHASADALTPAGVARAMALVHTLEMLEAVTGLESTYLSADSAKFEVYGRPLGVAVAPLVERR